jgi:hypothetical protein
MQFKRNQLLTALSLRHNREGLVAVNSTVWSIASPPQHKRQVDGKQLFNEKESFWRSQTLLNEKKNRSQL